MDAAEVAERYGAFGILALVLFIGFRLLLNTVLQDKQAAVERAERAEAALLALHEKFQNTFVPAALHLTDASKEMTDAARTMTEMITQMKFEKRV